MNSFQCSFEKVDVDAYLLESQKWFLFCIVKDAAEDLEKIRSFVLSRNEISKLMIERISYVLKTPKESRFLKSEPVSDQKMIHIEDGMKFLLEGDAVLNPGLFLDQLENRRFLEQWIRSQKKSDLKLLNLFSYTGSFSVRALHAGCRETTSVDVSKRYLNWEKTNHDLNSYLNDESCVSLRFADDSRKFIKRALGKGKKYSAVILDPPTFSKSDGTVFQVKKEFFSMATGLIKLLEKNGIMLLSMNDTTWSERDFANEVREFAQSYQGQVLPGLYSKSRTTSMKCFWLKNG